jgi:hypothetical protein
MATSPNRSTNRSKALSSRTITPEQAEKVSMGFDAYFATEADIGVRRNLRI